jgi:hypothetical protein
MKFLAENVFQSMDSSLSCISMAVAVFFVLVLVGLAIIESKLARLVRIERASYDLLKAMATEQQKGNEVLEKIAARTGRIAPPPVPPASPKDDGHRPPLQEEKPAEFYRID